MSEMGPKISITGDELRALGVNLGTARFKFLAGIIQRNILAERERCASIAEEYPVRAPSGDGSVIADEIAATIRASPLPQLTGGNP